MATLVINRNSISLNLESDHLVIHRHVIDGDEPERETLPVKDIDRVLIVGRPAISFSVLVRLMDRGIPCCFMTRGGRWRGILKSGLSHNGARRRLQSGKWFGLYYGSWLMYLGKADQAREYFRSVVRANLREAWSWLYTRAKGSGSAHAIVRRCAVRFAIRRLARALRRRSMPTWCLRQI